MILLFSTKQNYNNYNFFCNNNIKVHQGRVNPNKIGERGRSNYLRLKKKIYYLAV